MKEEKQAFGPLVGKATTPNEAHSHPLTTVPLALASPDRDLRQGSKASLCNYLMDGANAVTTTSPTGADWIIDGLAAVKSVAPRPTWGKYVDAYLSFCTPPKTMTAAKVIVVMDTYGKN